MNLDHERFDDENPDDLRLVDERRRDNPDQNRLSTRDLATGTAARTAREVENTADVARRPAASEGTNRNDHRATPLFEAGQAENLRNQWTAIQTKFVDEPRRSVEEADQLVASAIKSLAEVFANEREGLEHNWDRGDDVSTEDLRIALQKYRSFFDRLLSV